MSKMKINVEAVMFDLDGTILDSIHIYYQIIEIVFKRFDDQEALSREKPDAIINSIADLKDILV